MFNRYFKNYHLYNSKEHAVLRKSIDDEVLLPLTVLVTKRSTEVDAQKKRIHYEEQRYSAAMGALDNAKARHLKITQQITNLHTKLYKRGGIEALNEELEKKKGYFHGLFGTFDIEYEKEKMKKKLEKLKHEYSSSQADINRKKNMVIDAMLALDCAEENVR